VLVEQLAEGRPALKADDLFLNVQLGIGATAAASIEAAAG
jgi:hypothetical protein